MCFPCNGRNRRKPLGLDVAHPTAFESPPGIAALFVIRFDLKTGYVISWKRSVPEVEVEGTVEYKSLPSGLHNIQEDLVYFVHEQYAGISAFVNLPAEESERNAKMFAIGVLVPLSSGRLGKSWRHASKLKDLAQQYAQDMTNTDPLSDYWDSYQIRGSDTSARADSPLDSPLSLRFKPHGDRPDGLHRNRAFSDAMVLETSRPALTPFHPASSLPDFVDSFGPLVFPLYRAALLRKRVLLLAEAPVHVPCNYVYDLSLLASVPNSLLPLFPPDGLPTPRPRPLFNVGIHDIPFLSSFIGTTPSSEQDPAWIACTTDAVLSMKPELYDVLVTLPPSYSKNAAEKAFPKLSVMTPTPGKPNQPQTTHLKATQRDARRYSILRKALQQQSFDEESSDGADDDSDTASTYSSGSIVEPLSWTRLAYTSFIWWASAGEKRDGLSEEEEEQQTEQDTRLLASVENLSNNLSGSLGRRTMQPEDTSKEPPEVALVAYFRRLTTQIFVTLSDVIARHDNDGDLDHEPEDNLVDPAYQDDPDDEHEPSAVIARQATQDDEGRSPLLQRDTRSRDDPASGPDGPVTISTADMTEMGLDIWSSADRVFVEELARIWWGREARVDTARIRCCGVTIL